MSLLIAENLEKSYGGDTLFKNGSLRLDWGQKIGLVGRNGAGKTTLLRILTGQEEPDRGRIRYASGVRFGYLQQEGAVNPMATVLEEAKTAFASILQMEQRMRAIEEEMAARGEQMERAEQEALLHEYAQLMERFEIMGGYYALRDIPNVLRQLGFSEEDFDKPCGSLSGGEKTRLALARLLLSGPDILFLDEPTNHLDVEAIEWLESFLKGFGGALLLVSHDRYFLDRVVTQIVDLDEGTLTLYRGNYSQFLQQKQARIKRAEEVYAQEQREVERLMEFYEKWRSTPTRRNQAMARKRWAERIKAQMSPPPKSSNKPLRAAINPLRKSGEEVIVFEDLTKRYNGRTLFENVSGVIQRGDRIGVVGPNGAGKSTFIKILIGKEPPSGGTVRFGLNVTLGYFAQDTSELDLEATVLENMLEVGEMSPLEARTHLGRFLFTGDDVFRPVKFLSGGEKNKLVLAQITWLRPNLLVLDEPTNHLDIESREALVQMLKQYEGTLLLVSHDRYLLDQTTERTLEIAHGQVRFFEMPYSLFRERRDVLEKETDRGERRNLLLKRPIENTTLARLLQEKPSFPHRKKGLSATCSEEERRRQLEQAKRRVEEAERKVSLLEHRLKEVEAQLYNPPPNANVVALSQEYAGLQKTLEEALRLWEEAAREEEANEANE